MSTGYNGSIRRVKHCDEIGHLMENGHCVRTVHAEVNAVAQSAMNGTEIKNSSIYLTASPCWPCFKVIVNSGIKKIYFGEFYRDEKIFKFAQESGIELIDMSKKNEE